MPAYLILCCPGAGGLFLTSVVAQLLGCDSRYKISATGHAHDMGQGNWKGNESICQIGYHWDFFRKGFPVYHSHVLPDKFLDNNPDIQIIYIDVDDRDFRKVTELYVRKAWPDIWTLDEYKKWASSEYPPYSMDNIEKSELVQTDLINDFEFSTVRKWCDDNPCRDSYHKINFRRIMGIDHSDLAITMSIITGQPVNQSVVQYIEDYQKINRDLYFRDWA